MGTNNDELSNSCSFRDVEYVNNPTIIGKIVDVLPLIRKSASQLSTVVIYYCIDASPNANSLMKFKVLFFAEAADEIWPLSLRINDYIAFREAVVFQDYCYNKSNTFYSKLLVVESLSELTKYVSLKRHEGVWNSFEEFKKENKKNSPLQKNVEKSAEDGTEEIVSSTNGVQAQANDGTGSFIDESGAPNISSSEWLEIVKTKEHIQCPANLNSPKQNSVVLSSSPLKKTSSNSSKIQKNSKKKNSSPFKLVFQKTSPESLMHGIVHCYQHQNIEKNVVDRNHTSELSCVYTKLSNIRENMIVNMFAIVTNISEAQPLSSINKSYKILTVIDDTSSNGLKIQLRFKESKELPILQKFCIILFNKMKIYKHKDDLIGIIRNSRQVITFDKDDSETVYKQEPEFKLTSDDKKRVEILKNWMLENISAARPFTPLASIEMKPKTVNFRCQINDFKKFDKNVIVLRISDGTICQVPFHRIPFECNFWGAALSNVKSIRKPSREIDVIVSASQECVYKSLEQILKIGLNVELFNVKLTVVSETIKTKPENSLKAHLEGTLDNIIPIPINVAYSERKRSKTEQKEKNVALRKEIALNSKPSAIRAVNKRKLLEHSPRNHLVDSDETDFENEGRRVAVSLKKPKSVTESEDSELVTQILKNNSASMNRTTVSLDVPSEVNLPIQNDKQSENNQSIRRTGSEYTDNQVDSLTENAFNDCIADKEIREHIHHSLKTMLLSEKNGIQNRFSDYVTKNDVQHYFHQWPLNPGKEAFYIQVTIISTIPFINETSTDFETIGLVSGYCNKCDRFFPYYLSKWIVSDEDGPVSICSNCKENGNLTQLKFELMCELMLSDEFGVLMPAVVMNYHAENFFGCTVSQLCSSIEAKVRVRTFMDAHLFTKGKEKRPLIVKVIRIHCPQSDVYKYHILS